MNPVTQERRSGSFVFGLLAGAAAGVGLVVWLAPRLRAEIRQQVTDSTTTVRVRIDEAIDELTRRGQSVRDDVAGAVAHGAHEVERYATGLKEKA